MSKVLSNNHNGKVLKTSNRGYSSDRSRKQVAKLLKDNGVNFDFDRSADFSSFYFDFVVNDLWINVRVSDHTKRGQLIEDVLNENNKTFNNIDNKEYYAGGLNAINSETFKSVLSKLKEILS